MNKLALFTLAVLYGIAVGAFAFFNYQSPRPDVLSIAGDMHAWVLARFKSTAREAPAPGSLP